MTFKNVIIHNQYPEKINNCIDNSEFVDECVAARRLTILSPESIGGTGGPDEKRTHVLIPL
jgi:hypothetical protein